MGNDITLLRRACGGGDANAPTVGPSPCGPALCRTHKTGAASTHPNRHKFSRSIYSFQREALEGLAKSEMGNIDAGFVWRGDRITVHARPINHALLVQEDANINEAARPETVAAYLYGHYSRVEVWNWLWCQMQLSFCTNFEDINLIVNFLSIKRGKILIAFILYFSHLLQQKNLLT